MSPPTQAQSPPLTPPPASYPDLRLTLPTPPSFLAHRARSHSVEPKDKDKDDSPSPTPTPNYKKRFSASYIPTQKDVPIAGSLAGAEDQTSKYSRRVSFSTELLLNNDNSDGGSPLYKIPQRQSFSSHPNDVEPKQPPQATPSRRPLSFQGPLPTPTPTSPSRFASTAAARGLSIAPSLTKGGAFGSIWSAGIAPGVGAGWISPGLNSAKSTTASALLARQRGLSVAVIKDGGEVVPVTPGLGGKPVPADISSKGFKSPAVPDSAKSNMTSKRREIILCKFYHTPGLTCTSRPCRFVHNLDSISLSVGSPRTGTSHRISSILSPVRSPDPTSGTFAQAQATTKTKTLRLRDGIDLADVEMGETVVVEDENGQEVVGHVFLMSGGGNGPGGKGREKYKTLPCKDYAQGQCPYGDYCSFIHEEKGTRDEPKQAMTKDDQSTIGAEPKRIIHRKSSSLSSSMDAWAKAIPKAILVPSVKIDTTILDKSRAQLSAFAPPFTKDQVQVDHAGKIISANETHIAPNSDITTTVSTNSPSRTKTNAWASGPPPSLRKVSSIQRGLATDAENDVDSALKTPTSASHLIPPASAISVFGTESDPATPFDPLTHRRKVEQLEDEARARAATAGTRQLPLSNLANVAYDNLGHGQNQSPLESPRKGSSSYDSIFSPMYSNPNNTFNAPSYPWGMPMSPISHDPSIPKIQGGLGVIWTPAGWAVQDAAMRHALRGAEIKLKYQDANPRKPRNYFRTRPCKFFAEGYCPHGDECTYLHVIPMASPGSTSGSSSASDNESLTLNPGTAAGVGGGSTVNPSKLRTIPCKFYNSSAGCTNGDSCSFLHTRVVPESVPLVEKPRPWRTKPCRHYQLGRCTLGDACHFAHVPDPVWFASGNRNLNGGRVVDSRVGNGWSKECESWSKTGRCSNGDMCKYRHVEEEVGEGNFARLTEQGLEKALQEMRLQHSIKGVGADEDEDEDDVEIVTQPVNPRTRGLAPSLLE